MSSSQIGHVPLWRHKHLPLHVQRVILDDLVRRGAWEWRELDAEARAEAAERLWRRVEAGETVWVRVRPAMPAVDELQDIYGLTRSGAYAVLRKHNAPRQGRGFAPLTQELRKAIQEERLLAWGRKAAAERRVAETGCSWASAVRWAHRHEQSVVRHPLPAARTVEGQARMLERLEARFPGTVRNG